MAYQQRRQQVPHQARSDVERINLMRLEQIRSFIPLNVNAIVRFIFDLKKEAEGFLKKDRLFDSLSCYTIAIMASDICPDFPPVTDEYYKLVSNRSLVFLRLKKFQEAENDALAAINLCPTFIKGYWRASQAVKEREDGIKRALVYLADGVNAMYNSTVNESDKILFLVEMCSLLPKAPLEDDELLDMLNGGLQLPDDEDSIWMKVVEKLAAQKTWEGVALLFGCYDEVMPCDMAEHDYSTWKCDNMSVGEMFQDLPDRKMKTFGDRLATVLVEQGADAEDIGNKFGCPTLHHVVRLAVRIGTVNLLTLILKKYENSPQKRNATDKDGFTVLHILMSMGSTSRSQHKEKVLDVLLKYKCDASIVDRSNRRPIDYVANKDSVLYRKLFPVSTKSVEELRKDLDHLKSQGNQALKSGKHQEALEMYDAALKVSQRSQQLYKEAAILYSNRANVHCSLKHYTEALPNALAAINCDKNYPKGYLWKGRALQYMGSTVDAFEAYFDGYNNTELTMDYRYIFLADVCTVLKDITGERFNICYLRLRLLDKAVWPQVLNRLCKNGEWKSAALLVIGPDLSSRKFGRITSVDTLDSLTGFAQRVKVTDVLTNTVKAYIEQCDIVADGPWLDVVLCAILYYGNRQTTMNLACDENDCVLHAVVRFCLQTNRTSLLENFIQKEWILENKGRNKLGDSVFHCITKLRPFPGANILMKITELLVKHGLSAGGRDANGKLAVEYLGRDYPGEVFDFYFKSVPSVSDINKLKEAGNAKFKSGQVNEAIELYGRAITTYETSQMEDHDQMTDHEVAILYGNRAEAFISLKRFELAHRDAMQSVHWDGHWHKAHMRVGKCLKAMRHLKEALGAFINAYIIVESYSEDKIKVEIMIEIATVWALFPVTRERITSLPTHQGDIWLKACYKLVCKDDWNTGAMAYLHFSMEESKPFWLDYSLQPLCNLTRLQGNSWALDALLAFLKNGCDRHTIVFREINSYMHVIIIMTVNFGENLNLLTYVVDRYGEHRHIDRRGNTLLHFTAQLQQANPIMRYEVVRFLVDHGLNPLQMNHDKHSAIDYIPPHENQTRDFLFMAMMKLDQKNGTQKSKSTKPKQKSRPEPSQPKKPVEKPKRGCELCNDLLQQGMRRLEEGQIKDGYDKMVELSHQKHKGSRHDAVVKKAINAIADKLSETPNPEIPDCLTLIGRGIYSMIVERLAQLNKWPQLDMIVRKFRQKHGSDQLRGFASNITVVPLLSDSSLKSDEDRKIQILTTLLNSGATLGTDGGQMALRCAKQEEHYKVLVELVKNGADTKNLTMYDGDTPIHAALVIVLEKEKSNNLLEMLLEKYFKDPSSNEHLHPEQIDANGDCIFHRIAKAKFSTQILKLTEMLCENGKISADYRNKENKLPSHYISKKNDRRLQYFRMAQSVLRSREQFCEPKPAMKTDESDIKEEMDELYYMQRPADSQTSPKSGPIEVVKMESEREKRKRHIEELIKLLPDSKHSIFNIDHSKTRTPYVQNKTTESDMNNSDKMSELQKETKVQNETVRKDPSTSEVKAIPKEDYNSIEKKVFDLDVNRAETEVNDVTSTEANSNACTTSQLNESIEDEFVDAVEDLSEIDTNTQETYTIADNDLQEHKTSGVETTTFLNQNENQAEIIHDQNRKEIAKHNLEVEVDIASENFEETEEILYNRVANDVSETTNEVTLSYSKVECNGISSNENKSNNAIVDQNVTSVKESGDNNVVAVDDVKKAPEVDSDFDSDDDSIDNDNDVVEDDEEDDEEEDQEIDVQVFDNLEWEVECTAEVWKTLRDKHVLPDLKRRIVRKIQLLASGDWHRVLCKKLKHVPASINLFEAKFSKGRRIIWELAIAFSPRCSETAERRLLGNSGEINQPVRGGRIYSEIIRVWEIVLDHDKIHRSVQRIKKSHQRGESCIIQKNLRGKKADVDQINTSTEKRYPMLYAEEDISEAELKQHHQEMQRFFPPASSNDTEYHILKFYSFSSTLVSHVLQNIEVKVDFPFRVTDLEHAIINLKSNAPILLLGRSGTGKTTCCLYRLWSKFHAYWTRAKQSEPLLPRALEFVHQEVSDSSSDIDSESSEDDCDNQTNVNDNIGATASEVCDESCELSDKKVAGEQYDHLHQLFITKNAVLSSEVQKNFRELSHADDLMQERVQHEEDVLPNRLQDVQDYSYPLFLTSRQLLLMLDASLGPPHFFERREDGSLKVDIAGWTDLDGPLSFLPMLDDDSDVEDEVEDYDDDETDDIAGHAASSRGKKLKVDPRREITYILFVEEIWPKIKKKDGNYHPSLVWMEIMSFIKGSYEALSKRNGYLGLDDYIELGRKRAPNFSGERHSIYRVFKRYEHFKKQNSFFDETDLVHDVFSRLRKQQTHGWVVHQIFVDETQDFTQAELCLLIRLCQNPNELFLTGDTAQSIMRGISFRFSDLRSLFYHAKQSMRALGKTSAVEVPKEVYQLTHNYRSHAGILSLATSVLELMVEFFPESFDRLQPDQGLFHGPKPILLESCSFGDLAVLLKGNKRKTSRIEFGAHQAILVVNDAARDNIPEELRLGLVLTIYESKGLEFDDVLLYNFFKDSQASKEWRVVTSYLEELARKQMEAVQSKDNLVMIDHEILAAKGRPRSLTFDSQQHKVLNSELKHLYTALTRARVNVWMFDEDLDKRSPMFEYFKARKLVKSMEVEEINETSLAETVFAEKSSPSDWVKRGEDFMRHSLYTVAAKCFAMGGQREREKVALAHGQALAASRMKDNPKQMREEFVQAAELYLECDKPAKAALCLQNAKERELAADLFEKLGQYEKAGDIYSKMKRSVASSKCYEQLGNYHKAVKVLFDNENYDMAIDALKRYKMHIKYFEKKGEPVPQQLLDHNPKVYTEEKMSYRAADMYHRLNNKRRMLDSIDRLENVQDKIEFLKKKNYILEAAKIYEDNNEWKNAVSLLLKHGNVEKAINVARRSHQEDLLAYTLLIECRRNVLLTSPDGQDEQIDKPPNESITAHLEEACKVYEDKHDNDNIGQIRLLQAQLHYNFETVHQGWKEYINCKPFSNEAGLVECCDLLVQYGDVGNLDVLQLIVRGIKYMFRVCKTFHEEHFHSDMHKRMKYYQFYGLEQSSQEKLVVHPKLKPIFLQMLPKELMRKEKNGEVEVDKAKAHDCIISYLLHRGAAWLEKVQEWLENMREGRMVCEYHVAGLECDRIGDVDAPCKRVHSTMTKEMFIKVLEIDLLMIEFEKYVLDGITDLSTKCDPSLRSYVEGFSVDDKDPCIRYKACLQLWNDLLPASGHPLFVNTDSRELIYYLRERDSVVSHTKNFLLGRWEKFTSGSSKFASEAVKETEVYLMLQFCFYIFGLDAGKIKLSRSPKEEITSLEICLEMELMGKPSLYKERHLYTLMMNKDKKQNGKVNVTCVARRFVEALNYLTESSSNPLESVMKFSKFQIQLSMRQNPEGCFYPDLKHYLLWLEFFTSLSIMTLAKIKTETFAEMVFYLPNNYLALVQFIQASFPRSAYTVEKTIAWWDPGRYKKMKSENLLSERLKGFAFVISGHSQGVKIIQNILAECSAKITGVHLLERFLILGLTMICNIGHAVPVESERSLLSSLSHIEPPNGASDRIKNALHALKGCNGISDVAKVLVDLLKRRNLDETVVFCRWSKSRIKQNPLQDYAKFSNKFYNDKTLSAICASDVITEPIKLDESLEEGLQQDEDELERDNREKQAHLEESALKERETKAATKIQCAMRNFLSRKHEEQKRQTDADSNAVHAVFANRKIDDKMCGVCGYSFSTKLKNILDAQKSTLVGGESVLNTGKATEPWANPLQKHYEAEPAVINTREENENSQSTDILLQKIKNDHFKDSNHIKKCLELETFKEKYIREIEPNLTMIRQFINNTEYKLRDENFVRNHYGPEQLIISRLINRFYNAETERELLMSRPAWNGMTAFMFEGKIPTLVETFRSIKPYVVHVHSQFKQVQERRSTTAPTMEDDDYEEEFDEVGDIEKVVDEPSWIVKSKKGKGEGIVRIFVPARKKSFAGKVVLITGAGHGIGRELALKFNSVGARLVLLDINKDTVERVSKEISALGGNSTSYVCDVRKSETIKSTADKVRREVGDIDVLVNNAGILHGASFLTLTEEDIRKTFDINLFAYMWTCKQFLPSMIKRNEGHIINVASASAMRGVAYLTDYSASKCAVNGFTEALADEMRREGHTGIRFTCVIPMFVNTGMTKYMLDSPGNILSPKEVAIAVVEGAQMNKTCVFIPAGLDWTVAIGKMLPRRFVDEPTDLLYKGIDPQK